jgi:hypothetical protein
VRPVVLALALACATSAYADDGIHRRVDADTDHEDEPLTLDPALRFAPVEGLATTTTDDQKRSFALGPRARAELEARTWSDGFTLPGQEPGVSGWTAAGRYDVELAWGIHLEVDASLMKLAPAMNGMFDNGMVAGFGAALTKYLHWGHGNIAWLSLGVEQTELVGAHSVGVPSGTTVGLRVGTTF